MISLSLLFRQSLPATYRQPLPHQLVKAVSTLTITMLTAGTRTGTTIMISNQQSLVVNITWMGLCAGAWGQSAGMPQSRRVSTGKNDVSIREFKLGGKRQAKKKLQYQAIKSKWTCCFKTEIHNYSFDARRKIWNENVQRKFCQESSNLPFAVPGNVKLKLPNALSFSSWRNTIWYLTVKQDAGSA